MRKVLLIIVILFFCISVKAQSADSYLEGYYYNTSGQKVPGLISFESSEDFIHFKTDKNSKKIKIKIDDLKAVIIPGFHLDSLPVLTEDNKPKKKYFARLLLATPATNLYYKSNMVSPGAAIGSSPQGRVTVSYGHFSEFSIIMYQEGSTTYELTKKNYVEVLTKVFADDPELLTAIQSKDAKFKGVHDMLNQYRWRHR